MITLLTRRFEAYEGAMKYYYVVCSVKANCVISKNWMATSMFLLRSPCESRGLSRQMRMLISLTHNLNIIQHFLQILSVSVLLFPHIRIRYGKDHQLRSIIPDDDILPTLVIASAPICWCNKLHLIPENTSFCLRGSVEKSTLAIWLQNLFS